MQPIQHRLEIRRYPCLGVGIRRIYPRLLPRQASGRDRLSGNPQVPGLRMEPGNRGAGIAMCRMANKAAEVAWLRSIVMGADQAVWALRIRYSDRCWGWGERVAEPAVLDDHAEFPTAVSHRGPRVSSAEVPNRVRTCRDGVVRSARDP
jgi:hypothetical protein